MKLQDTTEVNVGEYSFWIRPFGAFKAASISGNLMKVLLPVVGTVAPLIDLSKGVSVIDEDIQQYIPAITNAFESLTGEQCEKLLRDLLIKEGNIAIEIDGKTERLTEDIANEVFCCDLKNMIVLAYHVINVNYGSFFGSLGIQSGNVAEVLKKLKK